MFRAEIVWLANGPTLKIEGRLVAEWAKQARCLVTADVVPKGVIVDLTEVHYIYSAGECFLNWLGSVSAVFVARSAFGIGVCERLRLSHVEDTQRRHGSKEERSSVICPMQVRAEPRLH